MMKRIRCHKSLSRKSPEGLKNSTDDSAGQFGKGDLIMGDKDKYVLCSNKCKY